MFGVWLKFGQEKTCFQFQSRLYSLKSKLASQGQTHKTSRLLRIMNIVTTSDTNFSHCLQALAESVRKFYDKQLIVYDLGLTDQEKESIDAHIIPIKVDVDFTGYANFSKGFGHRTIQMIKTTHKPFCVRHYFENYSEPMIMVDADCLFNTKVEEYGFDVGITLRRKERIDIKNPWYGIINAGVLFFNVYPKKLMDAWIEGCLKENTTDQKELSEILSETIDWQHYDKIYDWHGIKVKVFNAEIYNDERLRNGKIYHFKGKRHDKEIYEQLLAAQKQGRNMYDVFNELTSRGKRKWLQRLFGTKNHKNRILDENKQTS
jgi:hypothetical protein